MSWYSIRARARAAAETKPPVDVLIYGPIGDYWWSPESVTAANFVRELAAIDADELHVRINSEGGSVADGLAIYNALRRFASKAKVITHNDGIAYSIASLIFMAGDERHQAENSLLMIHAPWGYAGGNAAELREYAAVLDIYAEAMLASYTASGKTADDLRPLLTDGADHYYTGEQSKAEGFATHVTNPVAPAAMLDPLRWRNAPAAAAAFFRKETPVPEATPSAALTPPAAPAAPAANTTVTPPSAAVTARTEIKALQVLACEGLPAAEHAAIGHMAATASLAAEPNVEAFRAQVLAHLGAQAAPLNTPMAGRVEAGTTDSEKWVDAATEALLARAGIARADGKPRDLTGNPFRAAKLFDIAAEAAERSGIKVRGMDPLKVVKAAITHSSSDFPVLLENVMHRSLQSGYALQPDTWSRFCATGTVSDFRAHKRYRLGSLSSLKKLGENGEIQSTKIPDGESASVIADTKGLMINVSRKMIVNDDLAAFVGLAMQLGRSARRGVEEDVYALLASNPQVTYVKNGETLTGALFSAAFGNLAASGAAPSIAAFDEMRVAMATQRDLSGNELLDLRPAIWVGPIGIGGEAKVINDSQYDPDSTGKFMRPNKVRGLFSDVVDTPRLSGPAWYGFADPRIAPVIEVDFLNGEQAPKLEMEDAFTQDGTSWRVLFDYGVTAVDYRGAFKNPGA